MDESFDKDTDLQRVPILSKKKVNFSPSDKIAQLLVSNEYVVLVMVNNVLLRINLKQDNIEGERYVTIEVNFIKQNILIYIIEQESKLFT